MNQWCSQHRITETDFFRACRPSAFRTSGPSGLQQFFLWLSPVPGLESGVWLSLELSSQQPELSRATTAAAGPPGHGWSLTHNSQIGSKSLRMWQCDDCDDCDDTTTTTNEPNNFSLSLQELQCNCSATHWPCIRIVSVLQHNCKYSFSVYPFITTPPAGACSEGEKKKACSAESAVWSVCD